MIWSLNILSTHIDEVSSIFDEEMNKSILYSIYCDLFIAWVYQIPFQHGNIDTIYVIFILQGLTYLWKINLTNHSNFIESSLYTHLTWASKQAICCSYSRLSNSVSFLCPCSKHRIRTITHHTTALVIFSFTIKSHSRKTKTKTRKQLTSSLSETSFFALSNSSFKFRHFVR